MGKRAPCRNCERDLTIVGDDCCFVCYRAGKGLEGEEKAASLAAVKAKIENGGLRLTWNRGESPKAASKSPAAEMPGSAEQAERGRRRKYSKKEGTCFNCGRVMQLQARGACCICYPAAKIEDADGRAIELMKIRQKLGVKEFAEKRGCHPAPNAAKLGAASDPPIVKKGEIYPKGADIMRDVHGCLSVIILSAEEMGFIEALRAGRIAIIS